MPKTTKEIIENHIMHPTGLSYSDYKTKRWWSEEEIINIINKLEKDDSILTINDFSYFLLKEMEK